MPLTSYLKSALHQFQFYKNLGEQSLLQVSDEQLFFQPNEESNSISIIVQHLWGNMMSRWTNFLTEDGEKIWRQRDSEFEPQITTRESLMEKWNEGWQCVFKALNSVSDTDMDRIIYIRDEANTLMEAINRQVAHYAYHVGQIVFLAKWMKNEDWSSLSIPRNKSIEYNQRKMKA